MFKNKSQGVERETFKGSPGFDFLFSGIPHDQ